MACFCQCQLSKLVLSLTVAVYTFDANLNFDADLFKTAPEFLRNFYFETHKQVTFTVMFPRNQLKSHS